MLLDLFYNLRCRNGGTCHPMGSGFMCTCCAGFTGQLCDSQLQPPNPCHPNPCLNNGQCMPNGMGGFHCLCPNDFTGSICEQSIILKHF